MVDKFELITKNLKEVVGEKDLKSLLEKRDLKVYWGTAPTGIPHLGYFMAMFKIADLLKAGCHVKILFANLHAYLDNMKSTWEQLDYRTKYYTFLIEEMLKSIDIPLEKLEFVKGTDFQLSQKYTLDVYKLSAILTSKQAQHAGAEVVKQVDSPKLSGLLYPILQGLDEEHLQVDAQLGGIDQRKIFMLARDYLPKIGYKKRIHLMTPLVPGLTKTGKMSSSEPDSKIDFTDSDKQIRKKINKAFCQDGVIEDNGLLSILKYVIYYFLEHQKRNFIINRPDEYGGKIEFKSYQEVENAFSKKKLSSIDLKQAVADEIIKFITPIREKVLENKDLLKKAYPDVVKHLNL